MRFNLQKVTGFRSEIINKLIDAINSLTPINSPDITANVKTTGTELRIVDNATSSTASTQKKPFRIYKSATATGDAAWRTISIGAGVISGVHPVSDSGSNYSDDTATDTTKNIPLDASKKYYLVLVQSRKTDFSIDKTHIFKKEYTNDTDNPWLGFPETDLFSNATYRLIGKVEVSNNTLKTLTITQDLTDNVVTNYVAPAIWEPCAVADAIDNPTGWTTARVLQAGNINNGSVTITKLTDNLTLAANSTKLVYLKISFNIDDGSITGAELGIDTTIPAATAPAIGKAPAFACVQVAQVISPSDAGKHTVTVTAIPNIMAQIVATGLDLNSSGCIVTLLGALIDK